MGVSEGEERKGQRAYLKKSWMKFPKCEDKSGHANSKSSKNSN